jgi:hypothetical protein
MTSIVNKQPNPLAPHCSPILDNDRRPKSAWNIFIANQNSIPSSSSLSLHSHKFQRSPNRNFHIKMHRSENDLMIAMQHNQQEKNKFSIIIMMIMIHQHYVKMKKNFNNNQMFKYYQKNLNKKKIHYRIILGINLDHLI